VTDTVISVHAVLLTTGDEVGST